MWRIRWFAHYKRDRIWPDGTHEPFLGKGIVPAHEKLDRLFLRPGDPQRIEVVKTVFER